MLGYEEDLRNHKPHSEYVCMGIIMRAWGAKLQLRSQGKLSWMVPTCPGMLSLALSFLRLLSPFWSVPHPHRLPQYTGAKTGLCSLQAQ